MWTVPGTLPPGPLCFGEGGLLFSHEEQNGLVRGCFPPYLATATPVDPLLRVILFNEGGGGSWKGTQILKIVRELFGFVLCELAKSIVEMRVVPRGRVRLR